MGIGGLAVHGLALTVWPCVFLCMVPRVRLGLVVLFAVSECFCRCCMLAWDTQSRPFLWNVVFFQCRFNFLVNFYHFWPILMLTLFTLYRVRIWLFASYDFELFVKNFSTRYISYFCCHIIAMSSFISPFFNILITDSRCGMNNNLPTLLYFCPRGCW